MALDPRLAPGGMAELRETVATLQAEGIGVILDLVFNHTGESDRYGTTLSLRGLDNLPYYRHCPGRPGRTRQRHRHRQHASPAIIPRSASLVIDSLRHFVAQRRRRRFPLRSRPGARPHRELASRRDGGTLAAILSDDVLADRIMIAEPWDIGPGGYQLGNFPPPFLEWNDRVRDDLRCYWRGDDWKTGALATALAGSSDIFSRNDGTETRSVNFLAAHDGFTLMDLVSYSRISTTTPTASTTATAITRTIPGTTASRAKPSIPTIRKQPPWTMLMALISTLFASRGSIMLTAGDEGGRSQRGNNNAYCQDNEITWLDWEALDEESDRPHRLRGSIAKALHRLLRIRLLRQATAMSNGYPPPGKPMTVGEWETAESFPRSACCSQRATATAADKCVWPCFSTDRTMPTDFVLRPQTLPRGGC